MADPAVDKALNEIGDKLADLPKRLGPSLAKYETEVNTLVNVFSRLQNASGHLSQNDLPALLKTLKQFSDPYIGDNLLKILSSLTSTAARGEKGQYQQDKEEAAEQAAAVKAAEKAEKEKQAAAEKAAKEEAAEQAAVMKEVAARPFAELTGLFSDLAVQMRDANVGVHSLADNLQTAIKNADLTGTSFAALNDHLNDLKPALSAAVRLFEVVAGGLTTAAAAISQFYSNVAAGAAKSLEGVSKFASGIGGAIGDLLNPFQALTSVIGPFVSALNPALMAQLNYAFRELFANIGVALTPVVQVLTLTMRQLSVTLYPAMQKLAPIMGQLANVIIGNLVPYLGLLADLFVTLAPVIEFVTSLLSSFADAQRVIITVWRSVIAVLLEYVTSLFGGVDLKDIGKQFRDVLQNVVKYFIQFAAYLSKFLNSLGIQNNFIDILKKNLEGLQGQGEKVAPAATDAGIKGIEAISKEIAIAAFTAQGGGAAVENELDYLKQLTAILDDIKTNGKSFQTWLHEELETLWAVIKKWLDEKFGIKLPTGSEVEEGLKVVKDVILHGAGGGPFAIGAAILGHLKGS